LPRAGRRVSRRTAGGTAMARLSFWKMSGSGNDFILVDNRRGVVPAAAGAGKKQSQPAAAELAALLKVESRSPTGRVKTLKVGTFSLTGAELRSRLGLASTRLRWQTDRQGVTFFTQGYGHGVGLCQYGAQGLAQEGKTPAEILKYYYQGVEIQRLGN
ncbi:MAG: hypothetical protein QHH02_08110, partial [Syntrophomonadaceae bacterium]|nr:hypothetical protein [Syntrophomonadaceae bacterium]